MVMATCYKNLITNLIVDISTYVLKNQIINFKKNFFEKYKMEIEKMQKNLINKNLKSKQLWEEFMYDLN